MDDALLRLARRQHGLVTVKQVADAGHRGLVRRRLDSGEWVLEQPRVLRPALWVPTFEGRVAAVRLNLTDPGSVKDWCFSHTTAARLRRFALPTSEDIHVQLPFSRPWEELKGVVRHLTSEPHVGARVGRDPVTSLATTVVQCAALLPADDLLGLLEDLLRRELTTVEILRSSLGRGRSGSRNLRIALDVLDDEGTDRWMRVLVRHMVSAGLPEPLLEYEIRDGGRVIAVLDGYLPAARIGLEVDDWLTHGSRDASERDRQRDARLTGQFGINTIRTTPRLLRRNPTRVVQQIKVAYERALAERR